MCEAKLSGFIFLNFKILLFILFFWIGVAWARTCEGGCVWLHVRKRARAVVCVHARACLHQWQQRHTPCLRSLLFFKPNIRTLEKMSTRLPLHNPCFLPGLFRRRWVVGRWACCSLACRFWRINPLAIAAAMSQPEKRKQPRLGPCLQFLQLCAPEGTERRQNLTQTSRLPAIKVPYLSHNALKSRMNRLHYIFFYRYSID